MIAASQPHNLVWWIIVFAVLLAFALDSPMHWDADTTGRQTVQATDNASATAGSRPAVYHASWPADCPLPLALTSPAETDAVR